MSDQNKPLQEDAVQPFITREEAQRLAEEAEEKAFRRAQGLIDKSASTLQKKVRGELEALERTLTAQRKAGMEITPAQEEKLRQQVIQEAFTADTPDDFSSLPPPQAGREEAPDREVERVNIETNRMYREYGFAIEQYDDEAQMLNMSSGDTFLTSLQSALQKKAARLVSKHTQPLPPARTPTTAGGQGTVPKEDLMAQYRKEVDAATGNPHAVLEVRRKYRGLGLPL